MKTIRPAVFETNSSSSHCLVMCSLADWPRFVNGELFAECAYYHSDSINPLIDIGEVYSRMQKAYTEYWSETKPTVELVKWVYSLFSKDMLNPDSEPRTEGLIFRDSHDKWWGANVPDELKAFVTDHPDTLGDLLDWVQLMETPFSYEMIRVLSNDFTMKCDDYNSIAPYEETDAKKMNQWGIYYLCGPDYPDPPVMKCRAIWYS